MRVKFLYYTHLVNQQFLIAWVQNNCKSWEEGKGNGTSFFGGEEKLKHTQGNLAFVSSKEKFGLKIHKSCASRTSMYPSYVETIFDREGTK